jgi:hypothetical protein
MFRCGEDHPRARLTWDQVELMRDCADAGLTALQIARKFELPRRTVRNVLDYLTWTSAPPRGRGLPHG